MTVAVESPGQGGGSGRCERRQKRLTKRPWPGGEGPLEIASHSRVPGATQEWLCSSAEQVADQRQMMSLGVGEGSVAEVPQSKQAWRQTANTRFSSVDRRVKYSLVRGVAHG